MYNNNIKSQQRSHKNGNMAYIVGGTDKFNRLTFIMRYKLSYRIIQYHIVFAFKFICIKFNIRNYYNQIISEPDNIIMEKLIILLN